MTDQKSMPDAVRLVPHVDTAIATVAAIDVQTWRDSGRWHFRYLVEGAVDLLLPVEREPARAEGLWQTTCFEAFIATGAESYLELNFSPSYQWAAYRFRRHRDGMEPAPAEVEIWLEAGEDWFALQAAVQCEDLHLGTALGVTTVIEERGGTISYWALAHAAGPPDFHNRDCFIARLP